MAHDAQLAPYYMVILGGRGGGGDAGTREDAGKQTWHTDVDRLPGTLPRRGDLPTHLSMMLILSDKYGVDMHVGSHFGEHNGLVRRTVVCDRGDMLLFASTIRHRGLPALPGVGKQVVLFRFLTPDERHRWVDVEWFILDPLPRTKAELARHPAASTDPCPTPAASLTAGTCWPLVRDGRAVWAYPVKISCSPGSPQLVLMGQGAHTILCC